MIKNIKAYYQFWSENNEEIKGPMADVRGVFFTILTPDKFEKHKDLVEEVIIEKSSIPFIIKKHKNGWILDHASRFGITIKVATDP